MPHERTRERANPGRRLARQAWARLLFALVVTATLAVLGMFHVALIAGSFMCRVSDVSICFVHLNEPHRPELELDRPHWPREAAWTIAWNDRPTWSWWFWNEFDLPRFLNVSWLWIALLAFVPLGLTVRKLLIRGERDVVGRCANCGYDLQGGHERCPECGEPAPADAVARAREREPEG